MINLIAKLAIKNYEDVKDQDVRKAYGTMMSIIGVIANVLLSVSKLFVGAISGSLSITADGFNNFSDAGSQIISLISFKMSAKPADREHPFGHARMEYVASMIVSFLILLVGIELGKESIHKILEPTELEFSKAVVIVLVASILVKLWMGLEGRRVAAKIKSQVIYATSTDSFSDVLATTAVLVSTIISHYTKYNIDAYMGLAVAVVISIAGVKVLNETKNFILGTQPDPEVVEEIIEMSKDYPDIIGIHDMVVHSYGVSNIIASLHAEVDGSKDVYYIHDVIDRYEKRLLSELGVSATIHMDPTETNDEAFEHLRRIVAGAAKLIDERVSIHDCRYIADESSPKLTFDIDVPFEVKRSDEDICSAMRSTIKEIDAALECEIIVDRR